MLTQLLTALLRGPCRQDAALAAALLEATYAGNAASGDDASLLMGPPSFNSGAVELAKQLLAVFGDLLDEAAPVPIATSYDFVAVALGDLTATATPESDLSEARRTYDAGIRPEFDIVAEVTDGQGMVTGRFRSRWSLKRLRRA